MVLTLQHPYSTFANRYVTWKLCDRHTNNCWTTRNWFSASHCFQDVPTYQLRLCWSTWGHSCNTIAISKQLGWCRIKMELRPSNGRESCQIVCFFPCSSLESEMFTFPAAPTPRFPLLCSESGLSHGFFHPFSIPFSFPFLLAHRPDSLSRQTHALSIFFAYTTCLTYLSLAGLVYMFIGVLPMYLYTGW